jgi:hypothetical protein
MFKRIIPIEKSSRVYKSLHDGGYTPVMQKTFINNRHVAVIGVRIAVAPWEKDLLKVLFREADNIVRRALAEP